VTQCYCTFGGAKLDFIDQQIVLETDAPYGAAVPLSISSRLFRRLEDTARPCVRMAIEGTSAHVGAPPAWLERASEIRTIGFSSNNGHSILHIKAATLGSAAPELFEQPSLWPGIAFPEETALQVIAKISNAVRNKETGQDFYDPALLKHFSHWRGIFDHRLSGLRFPQSIKPLSHETILDAQVPESARQLSIQTPPPRQVRVVGKLEFIRHSTRSFGLLLQDGREVRGVLIDGTPELLQRHFGNEITILGKAIYRPSGTLLRLDAQEILDTTAGKTAFSSVPMALSRTPRPEKRPQSDKTGIAAFFGTWPGQETDEELLAALGEVRH
jgi:hypothetical protein